ncbi:MAG: hypothetical protein OET79_03045 [Nitrospirota bacterium]|nr:hypothetical protein [Nitrospirota bacterium]
MTISYCEWAQNIQALRWEVDQVQRELVTSCAKPIEP